VETNSVIQDTGRQVCVRVRVCVCVCACVCVRVCAWVGGWMGCWDGAMFVGASPWQPLGSICAVNTGKSQQSTTLDSTSVKLTWCL